MYVEYRADENWNEHPLGVAEEEQLGALHQPRLDHGDLGLGFFSRAGAAPKLGNAVPARNSEARMRGEWGVVPRGPAWSYGLDRRVPLPTPYSLGVRALLVAVAGELGELGVAHEAR